MDEIILPILVELIAKKLEKTLSKLGVSNYYEKSQSILIPFFTNEEYLNLDVEEYLLKFKMELINTQINNRFGQKQKEDFINETRIKLNKTIKDYISLTSALASFNTKNSHWWVHVKDKLSASTTDRIESFNTELESVVEGLHNAFNDQYEISELQIYQSDLKEIITTIRKLKKGEYDEYDDKWYIEEQLVETFEYLSKSHIPEEYKEEFKKLVIQVGEAYEQARFKEKEIHLIEAFVKKLLVKKDSEKGPKLNVKEIMQSEEKLLVMRKINNLMNVEEYGIRLLRDIDSAITDIFLYLTVEEEIIIYKTFQSKIREIISDNFAIPVSAWGTITECYIDFKDSINLFAKRNGIEVIRRIYFNMD